MADFENYMSPGRKGHLVGIGGVSMSSLAEVLFDMGLNITGSDTQNSINVQNQQRISAQARSSISLSHQAAT